MSDKRWDLDIEQELIDWEKEVIEAAEKNYPSEKPSNTSLDDSNTKQFQEESFYHYKDVTDDEIPWSENSRLIVQDYMRLTNLEIKPNGVVKCGRQDAKEWIDVTYNRYLKRVQKIERSNLMELSSINKKIENAALAGQNYELSSEESNFKRKWCDSNGKLRKMKTLHKERLLDELTEIKSVEIDRQFEIKKSELKYDPNCNFDFESFIGAIIKNPTYLDVLVLKHWVWQIKRKLFDKECLQHMMLVLYGKTNAGKSTVCRRMYQPLYDYTLDVKFKSITDDRFCKPLDYNYIAFIDELAKGEKTEIELIKGLITGEKMDYRILGTHMQAQAKQNTTLIGTSNKQVSLIIKDNTSMRRFWQFETKDIFDFELINSFNYVDMYRSIDENQDVMYIQKHLKEVLRVQEQHITPESVEAFCQENGMFDECLRKIWVSCKEIYENYVLWCKFNSYPPKTHMTFGRDISRSFGVNKKDFGSASSERFKYLINLDTIRYSPDFSNKDEKFQGQLEAQLVDSNTKSLDFSIDTLPIDSDF